MGIPAFFFWLTRRYRGLLTDCTLESTTTGEPVDTSQPGKNGEYDNLYLDMNGIIHPMCHPEKRAAPPDEESMIYDVCAYIDRLFDIVRPRNILFMAIDGVAPRAKMNQQRSRRFRAAKEGELSWKKKMTAYEEAKKKDPNTPPPKKSWDHNVITPGTPFMDKLSEALRHYISDRITNDPGWRNIKVILSDHQVPGEGEHKIMNFIRSQKLSGHHNPNLRHVLYGLDADLIMLGVVTHEFQFSILREVQDFSRRNQIAKVPYELGALGIQRYTMLDISQLKYALQGEFRIQANSPYSLSSVLDDFIFLCFFVGNDFLPHLPTLDIRHGGINNLINIYKQLLPRFKNGCITNNGFISLANFRMFTAELGRMESSLHRKKYEENLKRKKPMRQKRPFQQISKQEISNNINNTAASQIRNMLLRQRKYTSGLDGGLGPVGSPANLQIGPPKPKNVDSLPLPPPPIVKSDSTSSSRNNGDDVKLHEPGWKARYYKAKFHIDITTPEGADFPKRVAYHYYLGLNWTLRYYYHGCASWRWFYPYHYAPFSSDLAQLELPDDGFVNFDLAQPFKPFNQLMGVFPAASSHCLPAKYRELIVSPESPIADFYPLEFKLDLNGKKHLWQAVVLLPFVEEKRLLDAIGTVEPTLNADEKRRNSFTSHLLFFNSAHPLFDFIEKSELLHLKSKYLSENEKEYLSANNGLIIDPRYSQSLTGAVGPSHIKIPRDVPLKPPINHFPDIASNKAVAISFEFHRIPSDYFITSVRRRGDATSGAAQPGANSSRFPSLPSRDPRK